MGEMPKICIIGIDGLEYDLVESMDLRNLKQKEYGKVNVPLAAASKKPATPDVWASFLTGESMKMGFESKSRIIRLLAYVRKHVGFGVGLASFLNKNLLGAPLTFRKLGRRTFLDEVDSEHYNVPYYDFDFSKETMEYFEFLWGKKPSNDYKKDIEARYEEDKRIILEKLGSTDRSLVFGFIYFIDSIQHVFYMDDAYIKRKYKDIDEFVGRIKRMKPGALVLVVADHGLKAGDHTTYGFYSTSRKLGLKNPDITDFFDIITKEAKVPTKKEKEEIKARLKKLGYIQ